MAGQVPRPWFRLGSMPRPTTATTTAPVTEPPRPVQARIRPPLIRPPAITEPAEPTTPQRSKSPPQSAPQLPRPASVTTPVKKTASPPATAMTRSGLPSPSSGETAAASPVAKPSSPKGRSSSVVGSPANRELFNKDNIKQPSPLPSPSVPKPIPAVRTPYQSPKSKARASPPPSPLVLPPSQLESMAEPKDVTIPQEVERKTVVFQKVMDKPSETEHHISNDHTHSPGFGQNGKQEEPKKHDKEELGKDKRSGGFGSSHGYDNKDTNTKTRVITMAGENRGAFMEVVLSDKSSSNSRHHHQIRQNQSEEATANNAVDNNPKDNKSKPQSMAWARKGNVLPMKAFFNSNVQGINNSIMVDSKFSHHDPGIHLLFSNTPPPSAHQDDHHGLQ